MASIQPHGAGFRVHYVKDGKRLKSESFPTHEGAEVWMREHLPSVTAEHFFQLIDLWRADDPTPHRTDAALRLSAVVRKRGWGKPDRLTATDLRSWAKADPAHRQPGVYLVGVLRWLAKEKNVDIRPEVLAWRPDRPVRKAPAPLLTDAQVEAIRDCAAGYGERAAALVEYLLTYGARPITACRLRQCDLDVEAGELVLPNEKHSGGWRHVVQQEHMDDWQRLALPDGDGNSPLFPHYKEDRPWRISKGRADELTLWYRNTIAKRLKLGRHAGIYHLKRWAITRMLRAAIDPATVALFTGHLDVNQVLRYAKSNADLQAEALGKLASLKPRSQIRSQVPRSFS